MSKTQNEPIAEQVNSFGLLKRLEIYAACHAAAAKAASLADAAYPFDHIPNESEAARTYLSEKETLYRVTREKGRRAISERYGIDAACLDEIDREGDREKWSLWDGLMDESGPIPTFGPARTDRCGRIVMSDEERTARRDAANRAIAAISEITDETDTDERWAEVFGRLEGTS